MERITKELNHAAVGVHWFREMCAREENIERGNEEELGKAFIGGGEVRGCFERPVRARRERESRDGRVVRFEFQSRVAPRLEMMVKMEEANSSIDK